MQMESPSCDSTEYCGSQPLLSLPDDVIFILSTFLLPRDLCNLALCCRALRSLALSDKLWLAQCSRTGLLPPRDVPRWRSSLSSYRALCRFLLAVRPLLGLWVHQNPELGNVVFVMLGLASVVACRVIPQELGPSGIDGGPLLWAPVFEITAQSDGSAAFFLHGRDADADYLYPGSLKSIDPACNILLLEVEPQPPAGGSDRNHHHSLDAEMPARSICRSDSRISRSSRRASPPCVVPFSRLAFGDRRKLLELVANQVRLKMPDSLNPCPMFTRSREEEKEDLVLLLERRSLLVQMHMLGSGLKKWRAIPGLGSDRTQMGSSKSKVVRNSLVNWPEDHSPATASKRKTVAGYVKDGLKQMFGRSNSKNGSNGFHSKSSSSSTSGSSKHVPLQEFLRAGDSIGLSLRASSVKLSWYRAWPNMIDNRFALYKLPLWAPTIGQEYAGLWGGSFGWPPGRPAPDKPGTALFFILISYEELQGQKTLIATKILEGTHYVLHPNGSAMFIVKVDEPSSEPFPWDTDGNSARIEVKHAYSGEGIANGYGFRYPGSKPGSLFVTQNGLLAFVWNESRVVLTLQRLDLQQLLKKGEQVPALPPIANFSYLTKSYSNVFAGFSFTSNSLVSPRQYH